MPTRISVAYNSSLFLEESRGECSKSSRRRKAAAPRDKLAPGSGPVIRRGMSPMLKTAGNKIVPLCAAIGRMDVVGGEGIIIMSHLGWSH